MKRQEKLTLVLVLLVAFGCAGQVVPVEEDATATGGAASSSEASDDITGGSTGAGTDPGIGDPPKNDPYTLRECPPMGELSQIATNEGPFAFCKTDADCDGDSQHQCFPGDGSLGFCQTPDADIWCDGEGDVNLQAVPPAPDWGPGMCVYQDWYDFLCCAFPDRWDCSGATFPEPECELLESKPSDGDGCDAKYDCGAEGLLDVRCDGEGDGTYTSLCSCSKNGEDVRVVLEGLFPSEEEPACVAAAIVCLNAD